MTYTKDSVKAFTFGSLTFSVKNYRGIFIMSDALKARIHAMTVAEAKAANKAAWGVISASNRIMERHNNASIPGNMGIYEEASSDWDIADKVRKETYKRMIQA